ncbi:hypothetical protein [Bradyrhizobium elkanii]|uniref:hypothetical protein n=1 Tax=Bradyrhizobium elkanii TaxID=29448 RepID=UPI003D20E121
MEVAKSAGRPSSILEKLCGPSDSYAFAYKDGWVETIRETLSEWTSNVFANASVIELGAGVHNPLACSISAYARGAIETLVVEPGEIDQNFVAHGLEHALLTSAIVGSTGKLTNIIRGLIAQAGRTPKGDALDSLGLPVRREIIPSEWASRKFNIVHSKAVLEHVGNLPSLLMRLNEVTLQGAWHIHEVDFIDHDYYTKQTPEEIDKFAFLFAGVRPENATCNRVRFSEMIQIFSDCGIDFVAAPQVWRAEFKHEYRALLADEFARFSNDDLSITGAQIIARKRI